MPSKPHRERKTEGEKHPAGRPFRRAGPAASHPGPTAATCDGYAVSSSLTDDEPVSDAEIRLLLAVLGDTIGQILNGGP